MNSYDKYITLRQELGMRVEDVPDGELWRLFAEFKLVVIVVWMVRWL
jgi:hypothetical protein